MIIDVLLVSLLRVRVGKPVLDGVLEDVKEASRVEDQEADL